MYTEDIEILVKPTSQVSSEPPKYEENPQKLKWQSTCLKLPFGIGAVILTLLHTIMCVVLMILRSNNTRIFGFDASNTAAFLLWQFIPITLGVLPGLVWEVIYFEICRTQPYRDLADTRGSILKDSLSQTYVTSFTWFVPYYAWKHPRKHTIIFMCSITYLLSYAILPTLTIAMLNFSWNEDASFCTVRLYTLLAVLALVVSLFVAVLGVATLFILRQQSSGLCSDPGSVAGLGALIADSGLLNYFRSLRSYATQDQIDKTLGSLQICLEHTETSNQIRLVDSNQRIPKSDGEDWRRNPSEAHPWWLRGRTCLVLLLIAVAPCVALFIILYRQILVIALDENSIQEVVNGVDIRVCVTILSTLNATLYANWHLDAALLKPYHKLQDGYLDRVNGSSSALRMNFKGSAISNLLQPNRSLDIWFMALCAFLTQLSVILRPIIFSNLVFIIVLQAQNSPDPLQSLIFGYINVPAGIAPLRIMMYAFEGIYNFAALVVFVIVMKSKRKPFLPRKPYTLSSQILYICHSTDLLDDLRGMSTLSEKTRNERLKSNGHKYALGWMIDESRVTSRIGINRIEDIKSRFKYPGKKSIEATQHSMTAEALEAHRATERRRTADKTQLRCYGAWPENAR